MLRWLHRQLATIRYHSAARHATPWTRATDVALLASLVLAPIIAWLCDQIPLRRSIDSDLYGRVGLHVDRGEYEAWIMPVEKASESWAASPTPYGEFWLVRAIEKRGVPLPSSIVHHKPSIRLEPFSREQPSVDGDLPPDSPIRVAIEGGLMKAGHDWVVAAWRDEQPPPQRRWISLALNAGLWWIALSFVLWIAVNAARLIWVITGSRKLSRRFARESAGLCVHCGYDLRGLEFNERCPECGGLV